MDEETRELCYKEISNDVLDSDKMVNISTLSENWSMNLMESSEALEKWMRSCGKGKDFVKYFLVRGTHKDGMPFMTITPENKLASLKAKSNKVFEMLYSIKLGAEPPAIINSTLLDTKKKRIQLTNLGSCRESQQIAPAAVDVKPNTTTKQESSRPSPFTSTSSKNTKTPQAQANKFFKTEPKTPAKETSAASTSPKKKTPIKKEAPKKSGSIGSFFSAKPQVKKEKSTSPSSDKENKTESSEEIPSSKNNSQNTNSEASTGKRSSISNDPSADEKEAAEKNPPKRRKVDSEKKKARAKGSRIMLMDDSDEESEATNKEPASDVEMDETPEPPKSETKQTNGSAEPMEAGQKRRVKKRRVVTKTYEDEDGFIKTVKETEIYSSEEDCEVVETKPNKVEVKSPTSDTKAKESKAKSTKAAAKPATKQGSIMNFFSKK